MIGIDGGHGYPPPTEYLFIDGAYLRNRYERVMTGFFEEPVSAETINFTAVAGQAQKTFYYDCLHDVPRQGESKEQLDDRMKAQEEFFDRIQSLRGFHVRLGSLSGKWKKMRQKKVDVLLAVDMLTHAFHKNMYRATLIAGDLDFQPVVESLIQLGTYVTVRYEATSASRDLLRTSDFGHEITFADFYSWSNEEFRKSHPLPSTAYRNPLPGGAHIMLKKGTLGGEPVALTKEDQAFYLYAPRFKDNSDFLIHHTNQKILEKWAALTFGPLEWREQAD